MLTSKYAQVVQILGEPTEKFERVEWDVATAQNVSYTFAWWKPVFNRTLANCVYGDPIGSIDQVFMNRIEANTDFISRLFYETCTYHDIMQFVDTVWTRELYLFYDDLLRIKSNIAALRASGYFNPDTPIPKEIAANGFPGYALINDWEKCLFDIYQLLKGGETNLVRRLGTFSLSESYYMQLIRR